MFGRQVGNIYRWQFYWDSSNQIAGLRDTSSNWKSYQQNGSFKYAWLRDVGGILSAAGWQWRRIRAPAVQCRAAHSRVHSRACRRWGASRRAGRGPPPPPAPCPARPEGRSSGTARTCPGSMSRTSSARWGAPTHCSFSAARSPPYSRAAAQAAEQKGSDKQQR